MTSELTAAPRSSVSAQIAAAARANLVPGLCLQTVALLLVLAYYFWGPARSTFDSIAVVKQRYGYAYSFVAMAFFAGILPVALRRLQRGLSQESFRVWPFYAAFWGVLGVIVDAFYKLQGHVFGTGTDALTISIKVAVDMLLFSPFLALPLVCVSFAWKDHGFDFARTRAALGRDWYRERVWPMVVAAWMVWVVAVALIYALPMALQFPVQNIIECMWVLILLFMTRPDVQAAPVPESVSTHASS